MIEQYGNSVVIRNRIVPAVNIQVENVPGFLTFTTEYGDVRQWYGIYFEVMFEDASLWIVEQGSDEKAPELLTVQEIRNFNTGIGQSIEGPTRELAGWGEFKSLYDEKVLSF